MDFVRDKGIKYWPTPAEIPDLNPIENWELRIEKWHELKHFLRVVVKPMNKEELIQGIHQFWDTVTPENCKRYIGHLNKVLPAEVEPSGELQATETTPIQTNGSFRSHQI